MPQRIAHTAEARSVNRDERTIDVVASTYALDSYKSRIDPNGWELDQFRKNPVITWAHDDRGFTPSGGRPIAKGENVRVEDGKLRMRLRFPEKGKFPFADECFDLMADGFINAVSVGFDPVEWKDEEGGSVRVFTKQRLLEVAIVTIPSNDEALAERAQKMNTDVAEVRMRLEKLEKMAAETPHAPEDVVKWRGYFEQKQPCNRESTKVLERFFKIRGETQPADEIDAWKRMAELLDEPAPLTEEEKEKAKAEVLKAPVTTESTTTIETKEEPALETPPETKEETPPPPTPTAQEAPEPARKASVQLPLTALPALRKSIVDACVEAAVKASRQGVPIGELDSVIEAAVKHSAAALIHSHS